MLTASFFSLLRPAIEYAEARATHNGLGTLVVIAGVFAGAGMLFSIHGYSPHDTSKWGAKGLHAAASAGSGCLSLRLHCTTFRKG
jgi:zinc transporter ZupT